MVGEAANSELLEEGASVLIYKKGSTDDPANFRPITLQPVWYKIFASVYLPSIFDFLEQNRYIDKSLQKGFWRGVDGGMEHTELLSHLLKDAKRSQCSITVSMLDLKKEFGEVHHNLIISALHYDHLPQEFTELFKNIYDSNYITVVANNVWTAPIKIKRRVLQGDPAPPYSSTCASTH